MNKKLNILYNLDKQNLDNLSIQILEEYIYNLHKQSKQTQNKRKQQIAKNTLRNLQTRYKERYEYLKKLRKRE